jgi:hypothetical protein
VGRSPGAGPLHTGERNAAHSAVGEPLKNPQGIALPLQELPRAVLKFFRRARADTWNVAVGSASPCIDLAHTECVYFSQMGNKRINVILDEKESKEAVKKARTNIDRNYSLSMLLRTLIKKFLSGTIKP